MKNTVMVNGDKTLGEGDDGTIQCVGASAIITLPHEDTWKFKINDEIQIISNTAANVSVVGETGVMVIPLPSALITSKGSGVTVKYEGNNTYLMWGSLN